jgi:malonyl-CoA/methylmalonyl-CoA synthetase
MLLSSTKFNDKAAEVLKTGLEGKPKHVQVEKKVGGVAFCKINLEGPPDGEGGMMLYTSGTTNRPVSKIKYGCEEYFLIFVPRKEFFSPKQY